MSQKIKIAFFAEILVEDFDGASRTIFNIIKRIPTHRFEVLFICGVPPKEPFDFPYIVVPTVGIPFNKDYCMALPQMVHFQLKQKLNSFKPDIIHISTPSPLGKYALNFAKSKNIPVSTIYHTHFISYIDYYLERFQKLINPVKKWVIKDQKYFYEKCDVVYIPTKNIINELDNFGISTSNFKIWPRGVQTDKFNPAKKNPSKIKNITGNDYKNIIFASRLVWEKNLKTLIKIYQNAQNLSQKVNFIIAGDGVAKEALKLSMPNAYFLGHVDHEELSILYASSDVFLFTSISETYGNVVAEAMASGLPCVIANGGGSANFIENGVNGFLCEPEQSEAYLARIDIILNDKMLCDSFIAKGLAFTSDLKWEHLTTTYFNDLEYLATNAKETSMLPTGIDFSFQ